MPDGPTLGFGSSRRRYRPALASAAGSSPARRQGGAGRLLQRQAACDNQTVKKGRNPPIWVVRAGIVTPKQLEDGSVDHLLVPGLFGFSVQSHAGRSVLELAAGGRFPNASISVSTVARIIAAAKAAGYTINVVASPGRGYHATVEVPKPLPVSLAVALSATFIVERNPARSRPHAPGRQ